MSTAEKSPAVTLYRHRDNWMRDVGGDPGHRPIVRLVAMKLGLFFNGKDGSCIASYADIAKAAGCSPRTAVNVVAELVDAGYLAPTKNGGRTKNNFTLLMRANYATSCTVADAETAELQSSNCAPACIDIRLRVQKEVSKKDKEEGAQAPLLSLQTRESNAPNGLTAWAHNDAETVLVAETADDAPIAPALATEIAAAAASKTVLHKVRDPAVAGRLFQHMLETADDAALNPALQSDYDEAKMNPTVLHHPIPVSKYDDHDYLDHHDNQHLQAPSFKNPGRGVVIDNGSGAIIGTFDDLPQKSHPPPKARARTYAEAIYGVA